MELEILQKTIDSCTEARDMITIAQAYLEGGPVCDRVAAEAWLTKAVETGDPICSPRAMALLARKILGKKQILLASEIPELRKAQETARGMEKTELEELLLLV